LGIVGGAARVAALRACSSNTEIPFVWCSSVGAACTARAILPRVLTTAGHRHHIQRILRAE
jgi:hypothetical protein